MSIAALNWLIALAPVLALAALFAWLDAFKLMSRWELLGVVLAGMAAGLAAYPVSGRFLDAMPLGFSDYSRFVAPWIEEALKGVIVVALFAFNRVGFKLDAAVQGFAVGAGFAVVENIIYLGRYPDLQPATWMVRGLGTAVMHGGTATIMAALSHELAEGAIQRRPAAAFRLNPLWFAPGYLAAVAIHTLFNQFPDEPLSAMIGALVLVPGALFAIFHFGTGEARALLASDRAAHQAAYDALSGGTFPDTESGRRIAAFAGQWRDGVARDDIRRYLEVLTGLVLRAEALLADQAGSEARVTAGEARAGFARLQELRRTLGRPALRALRPLLPFTRNDWWELGELKERFGRQPR